MSSSHTVPEKAHAELGASVASRWTACPGSIRLSRQVPVPPTSDYAQEGTRAHAVAELCLKRDVDPSFFVGIEIEGGVVDEEMADFVAVYTDHVRALQSVCDEWWIERRGNLASLNPPGPMFGTPDFVGYDRDARTLYVSDLKYGKGVVVEVRNNKQLRYYGLVGALSLDPAVYPIEHVVLTIVQPRAFHADGVVRHEDITFLDLVEFAAELMDAARETQKPDAKLVAGPHCRFCPARGVCPEQQRHALEVAQTEFSVVVEQDEFRPPAPETIPLEQFSEMLGKLHILEDWASAMRATAQSRLERGEPVPGFKLVEKRATRRWSDDDEAEQLLASLQLDEDETFTKKLKSPAQIEKILGKKKFATALASVVEKKSSGYNLAPDHDPRPAVLATPGEEFAALLPAGDE